jgi:hypothetical protein
VQFRAKSVRPDVASMLHGFTPPNLSGFSSTWACRTAGAVALRGHRAQSPWPRNARRSNRPHTRGHAAFDRSWPPFVPQIERMSPGRLARRCARLCAGQGKASAGIGAARSRVSRCRKSAGRGLSQGGRDGVAMKLMTAALMALIPIATWAQVGHYNTEWPLASLPPSPTTYLFTGSTSHPLAAVYLQGFSCRIGNVEMLGRTWICKPKARR